LGRSMVVVVVSASEVLVTTSPSSSPVQPISATIVTTRPAVPQCAMRRFWRCVRAGTVITIEEMWWIAMFTPLNRPPS